MLTIKIIGSGAEAYAGVVDFEQYQYFEKESINLEDYNELIKSHMGYPLDPDKKYPSVPEEHDFGVKIGYDLMNLQDLWGMQGAVLDEDNLLLIEDEDGNVIWECDLSLSTLQEHNIKLVSDGNSEETINSLPLPFAVIVGKRILEGDIFGAVVDTPDDFDAGKLTIYYHDFGDELIIKDIEYEDEPLDNEGCGAEVTSSNYEWLARDSGNVSDSIDEDSDTVDITEPALLIRISRAYREDMTPLELYDYTRGCWKINLDRASKVEYAFSVSNGIIKEVYKVAGWFDAETTMNIRDGDATGSGRYEFVGNIAEQEVRDKYRSKSVKHLLLKGNASPVMYLNC